MTIKGKRISVLGAILLVFCCGCGTEVTGKGVEEPQAVFEQMPEPTETEEASEETDPIIKYGLDILPLVKVEAGTEALSAELFFGEYSGQELTILKELSAEELAVTGAGYTVSVEYLGHALDIEVEIIDTTPPTIVKLDDILIKAGGTIAYKKAVEYADNSSNRLELAIDNTAVDAQTPGEYRVLYTVTDAGGNVAELEVTLTVVDAASHTEEDVQELALKVLKKVYDPDASEYDNALKIFKWVHRNIYYTHTGGDRSSVWAGAYEGLHDRAGDCYAFYATYAVLLTYAGIENECVARDSDTSNHWWNLVNTGDGWYHCDASPRRAGDGYYCFMQTDAQLEAYTRAYPEKPNYYTFDGSLLPERETEIIYGYEPDEIYERYNTDAVNEYLAKLREEKKEEAAAAAAAEEGEGAEQFIEDEPAEGADNAADADAADAAAGEPADKEENGETVADGGAQTDEASDDAGGDSDKKKEKKKKKDKSQTDDSNEDGAQEETSSGGEA